MKEFRTTDTDELAPYPGMTASDLHEYEEWVDDISGRGNATLRLVVSTIIMLVIMFLIVSIKGSH